MEIVSVGTDLSETISTFTGGIYIILFADDPVGVHTAFFTEVIIFAFDLFPLSRCRTVCFKEVCIVADLVPAFQHQAGFSIKVIIFAVVFEPATVTFSSFGIKIISFVTDTQPAFCKFTFVVVVIILTIILYPGIFVFRHAGNQDVRTVCRRRIPDNVSVCINRVTLIPGGNDSACSHGAVSRKIISIYPAIGEQPAFYIKIVPFFIDQFPAGCGVFVFLKIVSILTDLLPANSVARCSLDGVPAAFCICLPLCFRFHRRTNCAKCCC